MSLLLFILRYVANDVGQRRAVGVEPAFIAFNFDAGKAILIKNGGNWGHLHRG